MLCPIAYIKNYTIFVQVIDRPTALILFNYLKINIL